MQSRRVEGGLMPSRVDWAEFKDMVENYLGRPTSTKQIMNVLTKVTVIAESVAMEIELQKED